MHCQYHLAAVFAAFEYNRLYRPKEVVERHFGLDYAGVLVALQAISRHVCQMYDLVNMMRRQSR